MKLNPLFHDSTKFRGDLVVVEIQVRGVELRTNEILVADLTRGDEKIRAKFQTQGTQLVAPVRLEYQQDYTLSPLILVGEEIVEALDVRQISAQYFIPLTFERMIPEEIEAIPVDAAALPEMNYRLPAVLDLTPEAKALLED